MPISRTERGFADYADFVDTHRARVRVRESSAADYDAVWIFIDHAPEAGKLIGTGCGAHLNVDQAKIVIAALQEWVDSR